MRVLMIAGALMLAGCATVSSQPTAPNPAAGLSRGEVGAGFIAGVIEGCAAAAEAGKSLAELGSAAIVPDPDRPEPMQPKDGMTAWAPRQGQGIVMINEGETHCEVSAYGVAVEATFGVLAAQLKARGYDPRSVAPRGAKFFEGDLVRQADGKTIVVALRGNEPGAAGTLFRLSTVLATVKVTTP